MRDTELAFPEMPAAQLILPNMRGACVTVGSKVHTLFRLTSRPSTRAPSSTQPTALVETTSH